MHNSNRITADSAIASVKKVTMPESIAYYSAKDELLAAMTKFIDTREALLDAVEPELRETLDEVLTIDFSEDTKQWQQQ